MSRSAGQADSRCTPVAFIAKWLALELKKRSAGQGHLIDLCRPLSEPKPAEAVPPGERYCFERGARKDTGGDEWADVWKRGCFALEYKGKHANLNAAFGQFRQYALVLERTCSQWARTPVIESRVCSAQRQPLRFMRCRRRR